MKEFCPMCGEKKADRTLDLCGACYRMERFFERLRDLENCLREVRDAVQTIAIYKV